MPSEKRKWKLKRRWPRRRSIGMSFDAVVKRLAASPAITQAFLESTHHGLKLTRGCVRTFSQEGTMYMIVVFAVVGLLVQGCASASSGNDLPTDRTQTLRERAKREILRAPETPSKPVTGKA